MNKLCMSMIVITILNLPSLSVSSEWALVYSSEKKVQVYYDKLSITKNKDNTVRAWDRIEFKENIGGKYDSMDSLRDYDCKEMKDKNIYMVGRYRGNKAHSDGSSLSNSEWQHYAPDTVGYKRIKSVCESAKDIFQTR